MAGHRHRPPRQPRAAEPERDQGRRPPGLERVDGLAHDRAVVRAPRGARPRVGQAARLAGPARDQLPARAPGPGVPAAPARVRGPSVLSEPHEGPRPRRLLDRQRRDRGHRDDLGRAGPSLRRRALRRARAAGARSRCWATPSSTRAPCGRRSSTRWWRGWARCCGSSTSTASRWTASCPTSPPGASWGCSRRPAGTPRRSSTGGACARSSSATAARPCARGSTRWATRSTSACCAPTTSSCASACPAATPAIARLIADLDPRQLLATFRDLGGHDLEALLAAYRATDAVRDRPSVIFAYTIKGWSLPTEGHPSNHSALLNHEQFVDLAQQLGTDPREPWRALRRRLGRGPAVRRGGGAARARARRAPRAAAGARRARARAHAGRAPPSRRSGACSSTSTTTRPRSSGHVVTVAPDVASSTNLGGWINRSGIWSIGERIDWFADDSDTLVRWRESDHGRHVELGIAEVNLVGLLGELGATWSRDGRPLLPVGTIYDPFVMRAHEPWSFGIYAGGQSILVGTPSGITLGPEGGAHQSVVTPSVGIEQPGCVAWEPAFTQDFEWSFLHALGALGREDGSSAYFRLSTRPIDQGLAAGAARGRGARAAPRRRAGRRLSPARGRARDHRRGRRRRPRGARGGRRARRRGRLPHEPRPRLPRAAGARRPGRRPTTRSSSACSRRRARWSPWSTATRTRWPSWPACTARRSRASGVAQFGQSGDIADLYRHHGVDAETIVGAALDLA